MATAEQAAGALDARVGGRPARVLEPRQPGPIHRIRELWAHRRLVGYFGKLYIRRRYRKTIIGKAWIVLRPGMEVITRALLFGGLLKVPSEGVPYLLFLIVGMLAWRLFAGGLYWTTRSMERNKRFFSKINIPRLTFLVASLSIEVVELLVYLGFLAIFTVYYVFSRGEFYLDLGPETLLVPVGLLMAALVALSIGLFTSLLAAHARDVKIAQGRLLGFWFYATPVLYPLSLVPEGWRTVVSLNPMVGPVELVKYGLIGGSEIHMLTIISCVTWIVVVGGAGLLFFGRSEAKALESL